MQVEDFVNKISGPGNLYGLQSETLASLVLSLLPPLTHSYRLIETPSEIDVSLDLKMVLMQELLQNLRQCAGFHIPPVSEVRMVAPESLSFSYRCQVASSLVVLF